MTTTRERVSTQQHVPLRVHGAFAAEFDVAARAAAKAAATLDVAARAAATGLPRIRPAFLADLTDVVERLALTDKQSRRDPDRLRRIGGRCERHADALDRIATSLDLSDSSFDSLTEAQGPTSTRRVQQPDVPPAPAHVLRLTATLHIAACAPNGSQPSSLAA